MSVKFPPEQADKLCKMLGEWAEDEVWKKARKVAKERKRRRERRSPLSESSNERKGRHQEEYHRGSYERRNRRDGLTGGREDKELLLEPYQTPQASPCTSPRVPDPSPPAALPTTAAVSRSHYCCTQSESSCLQRKIYHKGYL
uniref:Uncharacterized protein n=1 Tax=Chromera velia CCMP2878 TaxID=1169474 RepID=A0A0K6S7P3_9ALVE|eukprot:Cvel_21240.t1-p1 / transcript=Cvel_21240.t1 / gene=Cvel_21240 / organism=Chromera_velia_CCMP2878 / gene_product=hypothetical protein / transcript_product=hypothetical protein / location=Cvel_scaffold1975:20860-21285(+) / protein_length=142 / sequence_SO=supercontig / SO=protein_coding / is_pseudo=false